MVVRLLTTNLRSPMQQREPERGDVHLTRADTTSRPLLVVTQVPWEGPHRILDAFAGVPVVHVRPLDGEPLPTPPPCAAPW